MKGLRERAKRAFRFCASPNYFFFFATFAPYLERPCWRFATPLGGKLAQAYLGLTGMLLTFLLILSDTFFYAAAINFMFMLFNLIPIPPFDGSRIALAFLPDRIYFGIMRYERQIMFGLLIVMLVLSNFGYSPIGYVATKLPNLIGNPIAQGIVNLLV